MQVGIMNTFWSEAARELKPQEIRLLFLLLSQQTGFIIHCNDMGNRLGLQQQNASRSMKKLQEKGYVTPPKNLRSKTDGWHLTRKALGYKAKEYSQKYNLYDLDNICDSSIDNYKWVIEAFIAAYPDDGENIRNNTKFISERLGIDVRTIKKHLTETIVTDNSFNKELGAEFANQMAIVQQAQTNGFVF